MAWTTPITSNAAADKVTVTTFDIIGANLVYLKERADTVDDSIDQELNTDSDVEHTSITVDTATIGEIDAVVSDTVATTTLTMGGEILPTTTPSAVTTSTLTAALSSYYFDRGLWSGFTITYTLNDADVYFQEYSNGEWHTIDGRSSSSSVTATNLYIQGAFISTGSNLRLYVSRVGASASVSMNGKKY